MNNFAEIGLIGRFLSDSPYREWPACVPGIWQNGLWHAACAPISCARVLCPDLPPRPEEWLSSPATIRRRWHSSRAGSHRSGTPSRGSVDHHPCWDRNRTTLFEGGEKPWYLSSAILTRKARIIININFKDLEKNRILINRLKGFEIMRDGSSGEKVIDAGEKLPHVEWFLLGGPHEGACHHILLRDLLFKILDPRLESIIILWLILHHDCHCLASTLRTRHETIYYFFFIINLYQHKKFSLQVQTNFTIWSKNYVPHNGKR